MLVYLKQCVASVQDQGLAIEHLIMDGGSSDGTQEWLAANSSRVSLVSQKDSGMYDALNKGIGKATGEIIAHLNCDEQYLPGTLSRVKKYFDTHPDVDFIATDFLVVDPDGQFVAFRKTFQPRWPYFFSNYLYTTTCALFYRRRIFEKLSFDESYKSIADVIFLYGVLRAGFRGVHMKGYASVFTYSGDNLSLNPISKIEKERFNKTLPIWFRIVKPLFFILFFLEKLLHGNYSEKARLTYAIYSKQSSLRRTSFLKINPSFRLRFLLKVSPINK